MHRSVMIFADRCVTRYGLAHLSVLEVGSLNVNGSPREFFTGPYYGVDMRPGPGVDAVVNAHDLGDVELGEWDVIVCTEMLEHDDAPWLSLQAMHKCVTPNGMLLLTCRGYDERGCFPVHDYPDDLWRFSVQGVRALLERCGWTPVLVEADPECPGVLALARA